MLSILVDFIYKFLEIKNFNNNYNVFNISDDKNYSLIDINKILKREFNIEFNIKRQKNFNSQHIFF